MSVNFFVFLFMVIFLLDMSKNSIQHFHLGLSSFLFSRCFFIRTRAVDFIQFTHGENQKNCTLFPKEREKRNELLNDAARINSFECDNQRWHYKIFQVTIKLRRSSTTNEMIPLCQMNWFLLRHSQRHKMNLLKKKKEVKWSEIEVVYEDVKMLF